MSYASGMTGKDCPIKSERKRRETMNTVYAVRTLGDAWEGFESDYARAFNIAENRNRYRDGLSNRRDFTAAEWSILTRARMVEVDADELAAWLNR